MARKFQIQRYDKAPETRETFFDRQALISWWDQDVILNARVMVVGAGALGNETIKNLLLLGFRNLLICDFDNIETSNLSRTILFGPADLGKSKALTAADRAKTLCLSEQHNISAFHGDITSELGFGNFQDVDIVLGCVDNVEARRFVNRACRLVGKPWIDSGINGLGGHVSLYLPDSPVCYECGLSEHQLQMSRQRYSCDDVKRLYVQQAKVPTVQITSSIISGIQTQECVKHICGRRAAADHLIWYEGTSNQFEIFKLKPRENCIVHASFGSVQNVPLSSRTSVRGALSFFSSNGFGQKPKINTMGIRQFVGSARCRKCDRIIELRKPLSSLTEADLICGAVHGPEDERRALGEGQPVWKDIVTRYSLDNTEIAILDMTLADVGIPPNDILEVEVSSQDHRYIRLNG